MRSEVGDSRENVDNIAYDNFMLTIKRRENMNVYLKKSSQLDLIRFRSLSLYIVYVCTMKGREGEKRKCSIIIRSLDSNPQRCPVIVPDIHAIH